ncbi:MAG: hypothetical protein AB7P20_00775 [Rhizobiaceae bacterium]
MDWKAAYIQQQEARWRIFLMFVVMALMVIRTGLVSRGVIAILPAEGAPQDAAPSVQNQPNESSSSDIHRAMLVLLCMAEAAARLVILKERMVWELMNRPLPQPAQDQPFNATSQYDRPAPRLDTS